MTKNKKFLVILNEDDYKEFKILCIKQNKSTSQKLREIIKQIIKKEGN